MSQFNRMNEFFDGSFEPEPAPDRPDPDAPFTFKIQFPESPDSVNQTVKLVNGRLVIRVEFAFDDVDFLESEE